MKKAPLLWKLRNNLRWYYLKGWLTKTIAPVAGWAGLISFQGQLNAIHYKANGEVIDYGCVGRRVVTTAFGTFMVDQLQTDSTEWGDFKYHDSGVGITAEANGDVAMETTDGESRATGTQTESSALVYVSVGTISYTTTKAITEHGLFSSAASTTLMDRTKFTAINVVSGDSIAFTYSLTVTIGG